MLFTMVMMLFFFLLSITYIKFLKFLMLSEMLMITFYLVFNLLMNMANINFSLLLISLMIIESCIGIYLILENLNEKKIFFSNVNMMF